MEKETTIILQKTDLDNSKSKTKIYLIYAIFIIFIFNITFILIDIWINNKHLHNYKKEINNKLNHFENILKGNFFSENISFIEKNELNVEEFNENEKKYYENLQKNFCLNLSSFKIQEIESMIKEVEINYNNLAFNIFLYKENDLISTTIQNNGVFNANVTNNFISSLKYFSKKNNLSKEDVYFIDIGANIGWYSYYLGNLGYQILSFEPSKYNNYILKKNYCLNKDASITIINKSINIQKKKCFLGHNISNIGDSILICNKNTSIYNKNYFIEEINLTKLSNYISFLSNKNVALISLNLDGSEEKAIISGQALVIKYHVPFIYMRFIPKLLELHSTNIKLFLEFFEINGYKFSLVDFISKIYISIDELIKINETNLYIIYSNFLM